MSLLGLGLCLSLHDCGPPESGIFYESPLDSIGLSVGGLGALGRSGAPHGVVHLISGLRSIHCSPLPVWTEADWPFA